MKSETKPKRGFIALPIDAFKRLKKLAKRERRKIGDQASLVIDEAIQSRKLDPKTLDPIPDQANQEARRAS